MATEGSEPVERVDHHRDGSVRARGQVVGDEPEGYWEWFRLDGTIMRSGTFESGAQVGEWTTYDKNGAPYKTTRMKSP
ncbi:toxin-antitoxin system YwqK family antitoxin [Herbiconiux sp. P16]|uniref:toxin-antitoxin system YwqK family antitoxin n=1 Tax=Herbiconiux wuyangfengii TaxID=3342794 RepID=UPI0035B908D1